MFFHKQIKMKKNQKGKIRLIGGQASKVKTLPTGRQAKVKCKMSL